MTYSIEALSERNVHLWEAFNRQSREGTLFHSIQWKNSLEDALKLRLKYYLILKDQQVVGICPCIEQSAGYIKGLGGIPHSEYNNIILDNSFDISHINDVLALFSKECSFLHFETCNPEVLDRIRYYAYPLEHMGHMILNVKQRPPEAIWKSLSSGMRKDIRRFEKSGFEIREIHKQADVEMFYRYYAENTTYLNGDILPFSYFQNLLDRYSPNDLRIAVLTDGDTFAGGTLTIIDRDKKTAYFECMALNRNLPGRYTPTYPAFWDLANWAWDNGYEKMSFGRQQLDPDTPRFRNKAKFGAEFVPIHSRMVLLSGTASLLHRLKKGLTGG
jgi:hypothetical protein